MFDKNLQRYVFVIFFFFVNFKESHIRVQTPTANSESTPITHFSTFDFQKKKILFTACLRLQAKMYGVI